MTEIATFPDLGLNAQLLKAIEEVGYTNPTPIQEQAIPYILMGRDVLGVAQTGTGKTASFTLPLLEILQANKAKPRMPRALILAPTRELAAQIVENINNYGKHTNITSTLVVGGDSMPAQAAALQKGVDILIATPGRLLDHVQRSGLILTDVKFFVIDEADRMMDMGFIPDIEKIARLLPKIRQTLMFTATMPDAIRKLAGQFLQTPREISVSRQSSTGQNITQLLCKTTPRHKLDTLYDLIRDLTPSSALVFCNRKIDADKVRNFLYKKNVSVVALHGDLEQAQRYANLEKFKSGQAQIIVCSDVAARGIDIDDVSHVFNFDVPFNAEDYVHRIGRTGRAGKSGHAITLVTDEDSKTLDAVQKLIQKKIPFLEKDAPKSPPAPPSKSSSTTPSSSSKPSSPPPLPAPAPAAKKEAGFGAEVPDFMRFTS